MWGGGEEEGEGGVGSSLHPRKGVNLFHYEAVHSSSPMAPLHQPHLTRIPDFVLFCFLFFFFFWFFWFVILGFLEKF